MRRLQLLLTEMARTEETRSSVVRELEALGCAVTGVGAASLSVRVSDAVFVRLFGRPPGVDDVPVTSAARNSATPGSLNDAPPLQIPASLLPYLSSVSEAPAHSLFVDRPATEPGEPDQPGKASTPRRAP